MLSSEQTDRRPATEFVRVPAVDGSGEYILDPNPGTILVDGKMRSDYRGVLPYGGTPIPGLVLPSFVNNHNFPEAEFSIFELEHSNDDGQMIPAGLRLYPDFHLVYPVSALDGRVEVDGRVYYYEMRCFDNDYRFWYYSALQECKDVFVKNGRVKIRAKKEGTHIFVGQRGGQVSNAYDAPKQWVGSIKLGDNGQDPMMTKVVSRINRYLAANQWIPVWKGVSSPTTPL